MADEPSGRILVIGAHPDDCDVRAGGTACLWAKRGFAVRFVSLTDGSAGHHAMRPAELAARRRAEAQAAAAVLGIDYLVLDFPDGALEVDLEARQRVVRLIREFRPDLVLTHRPNDYHPDHRYTSQLVQDAAYMVTVPLFFPEVPFLPKNPVFGYLYDVFTRPYPFAPDVVVGIDEAVDAVVEMLACHASQFYEWLPFNHGIADRVPADAAGRKAFLGEWYRQRFALAAEPYRELLLATYGPGRGREIRYVEAFEISEYGAPLTADLRRQLFPGAG